MAQKALRNRKKKVSDRKWPPIRAQRLLACVALLKPPMKENPKDDHRNLEWGPIATLFNSDDAQGIWDGTACVSKFLQFFKNEHKKTGKGGTYSDVSVISRELHAKIHTIWDGDVLYDDINTSPFLKRLQYTFKFDETQVKAGKEKYKAMAAKKTLEKGVSDSIKSSNAAYLSFEKDIFLKTISSTGRTPRQFTSVDVNMYNNTVHKVAKQRKETSTNKKDCKKYEKRVSVDRSKESLIRYERKLLKDGDAALVELIKSTRKIISDDDVDSSSSSLSSSETPTSTTTLKRNRKRPSVDHSAYKKQKASDSTEELIKSFIESRKEDSPLRKARMAIQYLSTIPIALRTESDTKMIQEFSESIRGRVNALFKGD